MNGPGGSRPIASITLALATLVAITALTACGGSSLAESPLPTPTGSGAIAFEGVEGERLDVFVVDADGSGLKRLTNDPVHHDHPSWSPDGRLIAFSVWTNSDVRAPSYDVRVMNADGSGLREMTTGSRGGQWLAWSPDGTRVAFSQYHLQPSYRCNLWVMNADGSGLLQVTQGEVFDTSAAWVSNDRILFTRQSSEAYSANDGGDVLAVEPGGGGLVRLTTGGNIGGFAPSPDGQSLAIHNVGADSIELIPAQGSGTAVTLLDRVSDRIPDPFAALAWTPDAQALAVASAAVSGRNGSRIYIVNTDGTGLSAVPGVKTAFDPAWRPL